MSRITKALSCSDEQIAYSHEILKFLPPYSHMAVACSGGYDSLGLALLIAQYAQIYQHKLSVLIVDHKLRPTSTKEALETEEKLKKFGIFCHIITLNDQAQGNKQDWARQQRYQKMAEYCHAHDIPYLLTAHHCEDQAENILLRWQRKSQLRGLRGMDVMSYYHDKLQIIRPMLQYSKRLLQQIVMQHGLEAIHDPSNDDRNYQRTKMRQLLPYLANAGIGMDEFHHLETILNEHYHAIEIIKDHALKQYYHYDRITQLHYLDWALLCQAVSPLYAGQILGDIFKDLCKHDYAPRKKQIEAMIAQQKYGVKWNIAYHFYHHRLWLLPINHDKQHIGDLYRKKAFMDVIGQEKARKLKISWQIIKYYPYDALDALWNMMEEQNDKSY
jgi:tRNA(Ile)-lysidine synthetase-like protein